MFKLKSLIDFFFPRLHISMGGPSSSPVTQQTNITELPEWAKPYAQDTLARGQALTQQPYQTYGADRIAGFSPLQQQAQEQVAGMAPSSQIGTATGMATQAGLQGLGAAYDPGFFGNQYRSPGRYTPGQFSMLQAQAPELQQFQMQRPQEVQGAQAQAAELGYAPMTQAAQFRGPRGIGYERTAAERVAAPQLQNLQMQAAPDVSTESFAQPNSAQQYMSPYMQNVVDVQQREAKRQSDIAALGERGQAVQRGAFGGSRQGLIEAERQRNLATQLGDIQATGQQAAFQSAQQQFNTEQQNRLQAALANQQARQQAGVQNLSAALQTQGLGAQTGLTAQQLNQATGLQAALANQQAGLTAGQFNANLGYNTALQNAQLAQQANLANQALAGQYGLQQGQFGQAANLQNAQLAQQAALANQQAGLTTGQQNLSALLGVQQLGAGQNLQSQLANQQALQAAQQAAEQSRQYGYGQAMTAAQQRAQYGLAGQQAEEQSRQFGAGLGLQGAGVGLQAANALSGLGQNQYQQAMGINQLQNQYGAQQQALQQQGLSQAYQDFLNQQNYPYKQLGFMSDLLRGTPTGQSSSMTMYQAPGSMLGQLGGLGLGAYGMSRLFAKEGGLMESDGYAEGGVTDDRNVEGILSRLTDQQLQSARAAALNERDQTKLAMIDEELAMRASMRHGLASLPVDFAAFVPDQEGMANGGIVAFADGDLVEDTVYDPMTGVPISGGATRSGPDMTLRESLGLGNPENRRAIEEAERDLRKAKATPSKVEPTAKDKEIMARVESEQKAAPAPVAAPAAAKAPAKGISEAARIVTDVAKTQVPKDDVNKLYDDISKKLNEAPRPEAEALSRMLDKADKRAEEIKTRGVSEALMKFGFGMAASAGKPGQARRSGIAGALESAASASPILAESVAENQKLQSAAEDNAFKLRMEQARYQSAMEQGNKQLAASLAGSISQRNLQQSQLEEQIAQNARANALKEQEIAGLAAYRAQSGQTSIQKIADDLQAADPKLGRKDALSEASRISGYSFRTEGAMGGKLAAALSKIDEDYKMLPALMAGNPNSPFVQNMQADRKRRRDEAYRLYGAEQPGGVTSGQSPDAGAGQMKIVGVR